MKQQFNINIELQELQLNILNYLQKHWKLFAVEGVFFIILGSIAIIIPQVFTVGIALLLGWLLLVAGIFQIVRSLSLRSMPGISFWLFRNVHETTSRFLTCLFAPDGMISFVA